MASNTAGPKEQAFTGKLHCEQNRAFLIIGGKAFGLTTKPGRAPSGFIDAFSKYCGRSEGTKLTVRGTDQPSVAGPTIHLTGVETDKMASFTGTLHCEQNRAFLMIDGTAFGLTTEPG